jgi:hypothetical protein
MALFSTGGAYPQSVEKIRLSDGTTRTDSSTFTTGEIADAGLTGPYTEPSYDSNTQELTWDSSSLTFVVTDFDDAHWMAAFRQRRDELLAASDWTDLPNSSLTSSQKTEWVAYRQALRDLPSTASLPLPRNDTEAAVPGVFPTIPSLS